jgi:putative nucleotidyltransferase with HDIG domain
MTTQTVDRPWALRDLPPFPQVALLVMDALARQDADTRRVSTLIEADSAFAAELLRIANSPLYGFTSRIESVRHAVVTLGLDAVRSLCTTVALRAFLKKSPRSPLMTKSWRHSVATAVLAERVAQCKGLRGDDIYTAGLLHDIGRLALLAAQPKEYNASVTAGSAAELIEKERGRFQMDHCEAGAILAGEWRFPDPLVAAVRDHHNPLEDAATLSSAIAAGCAIADELGFSLFDRRGSSRRVEILAALAPAARDRLEAQWPDLRLQVEARLRVV